MGWRYEYLLLVNANLDSIRKGALEHNFLDLTEISKKANDWEIMKQNEFSDILKLRGKEDYDTVIKPKINKHLQEKHPDPNVKKFIENTNPFRDDLGLILVTFYNFKKYDVMWWTQPRWDITREYVKSAIAMAHEFGFRGKAVLVDGNSVVDAVDIIYMNFIDEQPLVKTIKKVNGDEGQYIKTLKAQKMYPLYELHNRMIDCGLGNAKLAVGVYCEKKPTITR